MSDIPSSNAPIQIEGALTRRPVSESLIQAMGAAINFILERDFQLVEVTSSGSWVVPEGVTKALFIGCGGGGGGGGSVQDLHPGGAGGVGATPQTVVRKLVPFETLAITIGAKGTGGAAKSGAAPGHDGNDGLPTIVTGTYADLYFPGSKGGQAVQDSVTAGAQRFNYAQTVYGITSAGPSGAGQTVAGSSGFSAERTVLVGTPAAGGNSSAGGANRGQPGGGGGSGFKKGGAGGNGDTAGVANSTNGFAPASDAYGSGGGGGAGSITGGAVHGRAGGNGMDGVLWIIYFGTT